MLTHTSVLITSASEAASTGSLVKSTLPLLRARALKLRRRSVLFRRGYGQIQPKKDGRLDPRIGHVVPIPDIGDLQAFQIALQLLDRERGRQESGRDGIDRKAR